jgi:hypothetical protein
MTTIDAPPAVTSVDVPAAIPRATAVRQETIDSYTVKRCFFPSHGRISRRVNHRLENGQRFIGFIPSFWWGPFCAFLVYGNPPRS